MSILKNTVLKANKTRKKVRYINRLNTIENELETLKNVVKSELYKEFISKLGEQYEIDRLKKENKKLRMQNKALKELLKEGK